MPDDDYAKAIKLIWSLKSDEKDQKKRELLELAFSTLQDYASMPPALILTKQGSQWYASAYKVPDAPPALRGLTLEQPVLETLHGDRARLVIGISEEAAKDIRTAFNVPIQPAPIDATEALVRAGHALAGAAIELTHVLKSDREKKA